MRLGEMPVNIRYRISGTFVRYLSSWNSKITGDGPDMNQKSTAIVVLATGIGLALGAATAAAQEGRFIMERTEDGIVRLDTLTGELSACSVVEGQVVCRMAADERRALEEQIDLLEERIAAMEQAITEAPSEPGGGLPSNEEIDRTFGMMEQMMRRFLGIIEEFDQDDVPDPDPLPGPEKTRS